MNGIEEMGERRQENSQRWIGIVRGAATKKMYNPTFHKTL